MATTTEKGYGRDHQKLRARIQHDVDTGTAQCWRCTRIIRPGENWDLGHNDDDRSQYMGPEHVACNRATKRHQAGNTVDTSRDW